MRASGAWQCEGCVVVSGLNNLKIKQKLTITFGAIATAILIMGGCVFWGVNGLERVRAEVVEMAAVQSAARGAQLHMARQDAALRAYVMSRDPMGIDVVSTHRAAFNESLDTVEQLAPELTPKVEEARQGVEAWFEAVAVRGVGLTNLADYDSQASLEPVNVALGEIVAAQSQTVRALAERQQSLTTMVRVTMIAGTSLALLIAVLSGLWLTKGLAAPLLTVSRAMRRLISGDTSVEVETGGRRDEIGELLSAVAHFKQATQEKQAVEARALATQKQAEAERAAMEAQRQEEQRQDMIAIAALSDGLEHLAKGDLTWRFKPEVWHKAQALKDNFNIAMERLEKAVSVVNTNVAAIHGGVGEISAASDDLSRRTEQQAATLEETAAALEQITVTVARTAEGAREAARVVAGARDDANHSGAVVTNAVTAMNAIAESSERIGAIIGVIDEIAFQTNLLALNAGVEAARAGDAGRGFAVVASEVRALAQRSAAAAKEIKTLISASSQQVGQGVTLVGQTGDALQRIVGHVGQIDGLVNEIAASAQEQATGLTEVNMAVSQMDQVTQQNAAMVEQSTAAAHSLANEADTLANSVSHFTVSQIANRAVAQPRTVAPAVAAPKPAAVAKPVEAAPVKPAAPFAAPAPKGPVAVDKLAPAERSAVAGTETRNVVNEMRSKLAEAVARVETPVGMPAKPVRAANETTEASARPRTVAETVAALKTTGRSNAALQSQPIEDGWEEF